MTAMADWAGKTGLTATSRLAAQGLHQAAVRVFGRKDCGARDMPVGKRWSVSGPLACLDQPSGCFYCSAAGLQGSLCTQPVTCW